MAQSSNSIEVELDKIYLELLQVAIGNREELSYFPTQEDWEKLFSLSNKHKLSGVAFYGIYQLRKQSNTEKSCLPKIGERLYMNWLGIASQISQRNTTISTSCAELCKQYMNDGMRCCVLKGQSNLQYYPSRIKICRSSGDIDIWALPADDRHHKGIRDTIEYVIGKWSSIGEKPAEIRYHHIDSPKVNGISVETHFRPMYMSSPLRNCRLQRWFEQHADKELKCSCEADRFPSPSIGFDVVYQLTHIYRHLFSDGVGLRQLLDYYYVLRALHERRLVAGNDAAKTIAGDTLPTDVEIMQLLGSLGMKRFAGAVMWVMQEAFAMPAECLICDPEENAGVFLLDEVMRAGNFGLSDKRLRQMHDSSKIKRFFLMTQRNFKFLRQYPSEVLWDPFRRAYNVLWCKWMVWRVS